MTKKNKIKLLLSEIENINNKINHSDETHQLDVLFLILKKAILNGQIEALKWKFSDKDEIEIIDDYKHLKFRPLKSFHELKIDMAVQIVEANSIPPTWKWVIIDENIMHNLLMKKKNLDWIRIPE